MFVTEANERVQGLSRKIILLKPNNSSDDKMVVKVQRPFKGDLLTIISWSVFLKALLSPYKLQPTLYSTLHKSLNY